MSSYVQSRDTPSKAFESYGKYFNLVIMNKEQTEGMIPSAFQTRIG